MRSHHITRAVLLAAVIGAVGISAQALADDSPQTQKSQTEIQKSQTETQKTQTETQGSQVGQPESQPETQKGQPEGQSGAQDNQTEGQNSQPEAQRSQLIHTNATIERIDKQNRTVTLKGANGQSMDVQAGPNVNISALKTGDNVAITYYEEMAVALDNSNAGNPTMTQSTAQRNGVTSMQTTVTATVVSTNLSNNTVVLRGPQGLHTVHVQDPALQARLRTIKPGQTIRMTYTQALATSIRPSK